jgi:formylglycine-generating enzyme required for sulfatase activity
MTSHVALRPAFASLALILLTGCEDERAARADALSSGSPSAMRAPAPPVPSASASAPPGPEYEAEDLPDIDAVATTIPEQREQLVARLKATGQIDDVGAHAMLKIMAASKATGQGNPEPTAHPITRRECFARRSAAGAKDEKKPICGAPYMVPVYDVDKEKEHDARLCIDRYEFPGLPCEYPVTWVTASQAQQLCNILGKRLCDAHEWEGACAGDLRQPSEEYRFDMPRMQSSYAQNGKRDVTWAYGPNKDHQKCATDSQPSPKCTASGWKECGSNTYPAGSFPACKSPMGVYDQHGNAAEHMLLPLEEKQLGSRGGTGRPEMKGSWFIFQIKEAHLDDCRWRAPAWHDDEGMNHANYHLSFRCCKDLR